MADGTADFTDKGEALASPLASRLFDIKGVRGVFLGSDFISVTKGEEEWQHLKPMILGAIMEHFMSGAPVVAETANDDDRRDVLRSEGRGRRRDDQGAARDARASGCGAGRWRHHLLGFRDGVVYLRMRGACSGCPSSTATLRHGIENLLRHFCPEVQEVQAV